MAMPAVVAIRCHPRHPIPAIYPAQAIPQTYVSCFPSEVDYQTDFIGGGTSAYSVWLTGIGTLSGGSGLAAASAAKKSTTSTTATGTPTPTSTTTPTAPTVIYVTTAVVQQGVTVIQTVSASTRASTPSASASSAAQSRASKSSKSGISGGAIAGIVIGVLALAAIGAIVAFLMLRRRKKTTEDFAGEYKRHIEPAGAGVTRQPSSLDNRLDTSLAVRRDSAESLADNQDYSRKILRVVN